MAYAAILSPTQDVPLLKFLWDWKVSTTMALAHKFFPDRTLKKAYHRLWELERARFIQSRTDAKGRKFVWTLTRSGYHQIRGLLPSLREEGFQSENLGHDLLVNAVHLGDWLIDVPSGVEFLTEQQLRRYEARSYPVWAPTEDLHRPDGYWRIASSKCQQTLALEVELTQKRNSDYEQANRFYAYHEGIGRVLWLVARPSLGATIHSLMQDCSSGGSKHDFFSFDAFVLGGWQTIIELGPDRGKCIADLLGNCRGTTGELVPHQFLFDLSKSPHKSSSSKLFRLGDFCD